MSSRFTRPVLIVVLGLVCLTWAPGLCFAGKEPKKRVAVMDFENAAGYSQASKDLGRGLADMLVARLLSTDRFIVLERMNLDDVFEEHQLIENGAVVPEVASRLTSAQVLIRGTVTQIEEVEAGGQGLRLKKMRLGHKAVKVRIALNIRLIDVTTGQVLASRMVDGEAVDRSFLGRVDSKHVGLEGDQKTSPSMGEAVGELMDDAVLGIIEGMSKIPWQGSVIKVSGREIWVNAGTQENVEPGMELVVYERGEEMIDPETNENLGRMDEEIGLVRIDKTSQRFSIATVVEGEGFARGNLVKPFADASDLGISEAVPAAGR